MAEEAKVILLGLGITVLAAIISRYFNDEDEYYD
jgi:hypothetical protein